MNKLLLNINEVTQFKDLSSFRCCFLIDWNRVFIIFYHRNKQLFFELSELQLHESVDWSITIVFFFISVNTTKSFQLAAAIMSGEPDSGTGPGGSGVKLEPPINNNNNEDTECDKVTASNTNFDSKDGLKILQCERCGEFETISLALLLVHVAQCNPSNRGEAENHNDANSNDQQPPSDANKQSRKLFEVINCIYC